MRDIIINIFTLIGTKSADEDRKGKIVFDEIIKKTQDNDLRVVLDFEQIELVNTAFLNNAVGELLDKSKYNIEKNNVRIMNMKPAMIDLLKETLIVAKERYKDSKSGD